MMKQLVLLTILLFSIQMAVGNPQERLLRDLASRVPDYNNLIRPVENASDVVKVDLNMMIYHIRRTQKASSDLEALVYASMNWKDENLAWDPKSYGGIKEARIPKTWIWKPDFRFFKADSDLAGEQQDTNLAVVFSDGKITIVNSLYMPFICAQLGGKNPRFNCTQDVGSWTYKKAEVDISVSDYGNQELVPDSDWILEKFTQAKVEKSYPGVPDVYVSAHYNMIASQKNGKPSKPRRNSNKL